MTLAICANCGKEKREPQGKCGSCGFQPRSIPEQAQALYLSHGMFTPEQREQTPELVPPEMPIEQLRVIAAEIQAGKQHAYEPERLNKLLAQHNALSQVKSIHIASALLRLFGPALLFIAGLFLVGRLLQSLH